MAVKGFFAKLKNLFSFTELDDDFFDELEELLILSDVGMTMTEEIMDKLHKVVQNEIIRTNDDLREALKDMMKDILKTYTADFAWEEEPSVLLFVGVNGVGKTTSIGKLATAAKEAGRTPLLVAADTFRAAAAEQLTIWAERSGADIVKQKEGTDPAAVLFDGLKAGRARGADLILCDTAGRLHNKKNLMDELGKMNRIVEREMSDYRKETLLVLDATTGQNALSQAHVFLEATHVSGIILTKTDGTAKGGVVLAIQKELGLPIVYIGCGEGVHDLKRFDADEFIETMFA